MSTRYPRILPLVIACPLFLQNLDTSVMATALPTMAGALHVRVLDLNLAITAYLLSLAVSLPASAWLADRFGAKRVFGAAVFLFSAGSALCGLATSLETLVLYRILQGVGGGMMVPVARTILLRSVRSEDMVRAMVWFTVPGAVGRLAGPLLGGIVVSFTSWRWIFLVNIPFGLLGLALAAWLVDADPVRQEEPPPFDLAGLAWIALALVGMLGGLEMMGKTLLPALAVAAMLLAGMVAFVAYARHVRRSAHPILDFGVLRYATFRLTIVGALPIRVALGAAPFLLPLMMQLGFGLSPLDSGLITMATAVGALGTRVLMTHAIRALGFRRLLITCGCVAGVFYAIYGQFTPATPRPLMFVLLMVGGLFMSATMVSLSTVGYTDIPSSRHGHAAALASMAQQLSTAVGVVFGASALMLASVLHGGDGQHLQARDFPPAFAGIALLAIASGLAFRGFHPETGEEMRGRKRVAQ